MVATQEKNLPKAKATLPMNSRDAILERIRDALAPSESSGTSDPVPPQHTVGDVWPLEGLTTEPLVERFETSLQAVHGQMHRCADVQEARSTLVELVDQSGWTRLGAVDRPLCREVAAALDADRLAWTRPGWDPRSIAELSAGLVAAERLLADTGTCVVANDTTQQRLMCYLPPTCIVVGRVDQLVEHMPAAWEEIARQTAEPDRRGEFVLITGPSRTADIEKVLILGAHGPKRLIVLLIG